MRWLLISPNGTPVSSCDASDLTTARERLGWREGMVSRVQSQASWDLRFAPMKDGAVARKAGKDFRDQRAGAKPVVGSAYSGHKRANLNAGK